MHPPFPLLSRSLHDLGQRKTHGKTEQSSDDVKIDKVMVQVKLHLQNGKSSSSHMNHES